MPSMGGKITTPYRGDKEHLQDLLLLIEHRQKLYTLKTRAFDWVEDPMAEAASDAAKVHDAREAEIGRLMTSIHTVARRIRAKTALARAKGRKLSTDRLAEEYELEELDVQILIALLLDDISVSGAKTYARGKDILGLLLDDSMSVLDARRHLYTVSPLMRHGLIALSSPPETSVLDAYFKISEPGENLARCRTQFDVVRRIEGSARRPDDLVGRIARRSRDRGGSGTIRPREQE